MYYLKIVLIGKRNIFIAKIVGIPVCHRGYLILQGQISAVTSPAQSLYGDLQVLLEIYGVCYMPAVHIEKSLRIIGLIRGTHLMKSRIGRTVLPVAANVKITGAAEIILSSRAAKGGKITVSVDEEFHLALAPPAVGLNAPTDIGANVVALTANLIKNCIILLIGQASRAIKACVEIKASLGESLFLAVYLIIKIADALADIFDLYSESAVIGHLKIAVHSLCRVYAHSKA